MRTRTRTIAASLVAAAALSGLVACSSDPADTATSAIAAASEAAGAAESADAAAAGAGGTPEMQALCAQMVADGLTPDAATALATENGYVARVGTIDGEPQALTMDLREDRFTFEVTGGVVVACTYG
jgi:hypothetical protein